METKAIAPQDNVMASCLKGSCPAEPKSLDQHIQDDPDYQHLDTQEISKLLGFFTQQRFQGFPWYLYKPRDESSRRKPISEMEGFFRLSEGKPIELQPMREVKMDISAQQLAGVAALGTPLSASANIATSLANANVGSKTLKRETKSGAPVLIRNLPYLKLLYQLHSPDQPDNPQNALAKTVKDFSYFIAESKFSSYPWSFHNPTRSLWKAMKTSIGRSITHASWFGIVGAIGGAVIGGPIGAAAGIGLGGILHAIGMGALFGIVCGGIHGALKPIISQHGEAYDEITALDRILRNQPVYFQKERVQSVDLPILGSFSWHSDYGEANLISSPEELSILSGMQINVQGKS